jgi:hypothetical protein
MDFDLNINNYSKEDYFDIFNLDKNMNPSKNSVNENYNNLLNNINNENIDLDEKKKLKTFLTNCKQNLLFIIEKETDNYKLIDSDFIPNLNKSETFQSNSKFIIKKQENPDIHHTNKINPISRRTNTQLLNINTKFRTNYYDTISSDFILNLPVEFKNVTSITVQNVEIPETEYIFSSTNGTNEFSIELYDINKTSGEIVAGTQKKQIIRIQDGIYTGFMLEDYLNNYVFTDNSLNRICCKYDEISRKFRITRDYRDSEKRGIPYSDTENTRAFNIDWRLSSDENRPIQLNMGWILGYRKQYYSWDEDYVDISNVSYKKHEGFNPEACYDPLVSKYYILAIDDYNKNYSNTLCSPFQESAFNNNTAMAKIPHTPTSPNYDNIFYKSRREYFGPVNIKKLHIKLLDEMGRIVNLNNSDYSFTIEIKQLYDIHTNSL